jgi:hypothetical protein
MIIYLYIKQHVKSGLKYFGQTRKSNPFKYLGSGKYWQSHIKKHGKEYIKTLEVWGFDDKELCEKFALKFSKENNIVESKEWANLVVEDGISCPSKFFTKELRAQIGKKVSLANKGKSPSEETRLKIGNSNRNKIRSIETIEKLKLSHRGLKQSEESNIKRRNSLKNKKRDPAIGEKISNSKKGVIPKQTQCPHCNKTGSLTTMYRWHFDKCKSITL